MKIAIFGLGYVGFTAACCLAHDGHEVIGIDTNADKVAEINAGQPPIKEPKVGELLTEALGKGLIRAVTEISDLSDVDLAIVCVGTPSSTDGSHNMSFVAEVTRQIAETVSGARNAAADGGLSVDLPARHGQAAGRADFPQLPWRADGPGGRKSSITLNSCARHRR